MLHHGCLQKKNPGRGNFSGDSFSTPLGFGGWGLGQRPQPPEIKGSEDGTPNAWRLYSVVPPKRTLGRTPKMMLHLITS